MRTSFYVVIVFFVLAALAEEVSKQYFEAQARVVKAQTPTCPPCPIVPPCPNVPARGSDITVIPCNKTPSSTGN